MKITTNGLFHIDTDIHGFGGGTSVVYISGTFGLAVVQLVYIDEGGNEVNLEDGLLLVNTQNIVNHGEGATMAARVTLADGTTEIFIVAKGKV